MLCNGLHTHLVKGSLVLKRLPTNGRDRRGAILVSNPQVSTWGTEQVVTYPRPHRESELNPESCAYLCVWRCSIAPENPEGQCPHCHCRQWLRRSISSLGAGLWQGIYSCRPSLCLWTTCQYWHHIQDTIIHLLVVFCIWAVVQGQAIWYSFSQLQITGWSGKAKN